MENKYGELSKLMRILDKNGMKYQFVETPIVYQVVIFIQGQIYKIDAITFKDNMKRLEIMGAMSKREIRKYDNDVLGGLTARQVARRFLWCCKHHTPIYKDKHWRDK